MAKSFREVIGVSPSTASTKDSALVIIDAQNESPQDRVSSTRKAIADLLEKYRIAGGSISHVVHLTPEGAPVFTPGTELAKEFSELTPKGGEKVIGKHHPSSFAGTDLDAFLKKERKERDCLDRIWHLFASQLRVGLVRGLDRIPFLQKMQLVIEIPGTKADEVVKMVMIELGDAFGTVVKSSSIE